MSRFINNLKRRVAKEQKKIVLPESESRRVLQAAERVQAEGFARPILIGRPQSIVEVASEYQIDMDGIEIIDPETYPMMDKFCQYYAKRRAKKGMSLEEARKVLSENYIFFAACLVAFDIADGMVAGAVATSSEVIRAALQVIGPHPGLSTVSSSFIMITDKPQFGDDGIFVVGDCSVVIEPTPQQLAGASVAISENTMMDYLMSQYEQELGIPAAEVHTVQMPNLALRTEAVLAGKDIQAAILPDPLAAYAVQQGAHVVIDDTKLQKNYSQSVVVLTQDMIEKHHDDAAYFLDAYNEAIEKLDSQPDAYRDMAMKKANIPAAVAGSYRTPSYTAHALPTEEEVSRIMNWMVEKGLLPKAYSYDEMGAHVQ